MAGGESPQERQGHSPKRTRRRPDPLAGGLWEAALTWLEPTPEIDAKTLFEHLLGSCGEWIAAAGGALRTFQRRVQLWRELNGPPKEVYFPQIREPGKSMQFDWTRVKERDFTITIAGEPFVHLLTHAVLPYSNWEWAVPCRSESGLSLKRGVQEALWELGGTAPVLQTDQSSAATHQITRKDKKRTFNEEYLAFWVNNNPSLIANGAFGFNPLHGGPGFESFPSGHTTAICAVVVTLWIYYPRLSVLYLLPVLIISVGLIGANYHFVSDIVAGSLLGTSIAIFCTALFSKYSAQPQGVKSNI